MRRPTITGRVDSETINRHFSNLAINDFVYGPAKLSGSTVHGKAWIDGWPSHDVTITGKFRLSAGSIAGTITSIEVEWPYSGSTVYSISNVRIPAKKFLKNVADQSFATKEMMEYYGELSIFGPGAPGEELVAGRKGGALTGTLGDDTLMGKQGADEARGGLGDDLLSGSLGSDTLYGDDNNDTLSGGRGADALYGGADDDSLDGGDGDDLMTGERGNDTLEGGKGGDMLLGEIGNDVLSGGAGADSLDGSFGQDSLSGSSGADTLSGGSGYDLLVAGRGRDRLDGGSENDRLVGGEGNDTLTGGLGDDVFVFFGKLRREADVITDFNFIQDDLEISGGNGQYRIEANGLNSSILFYGTNSITFENVSTTTLTIYMGANDVFT